MPPRESTSRPPRSNVYSVLLIVSAVFLMLAVAITIQEIRSDYDWGGQTSVYDDTGEVDETGEVVDDTGDVVDDVVDDEPAE